MSSPDHLVLILELLVTGSPERPEGRLSSPDGAVLSFSGWLALGTALEEASRAAARSARGEPATGVEDRGE